MESSIYISNNTKPEKEKRELRLLTLNCCLLPKLIYQSDGSDNRRQRAQLISSMISRYDIVMLQEVFGSTWTREWREIISDTPGMDKVLSVKGQGKTLDSGLIILSKFPIVKHRFIRFKQNSLLNNLIIDRGFLYAEIKVGSKSIHVFNTHLNPNELSVGKTPAYWRKMQLQEMLDYKKYIGKDQDHWVIGGDFNDDVIAFEMLKNYHISLAATKAPTWHMLTPYVIKCDNTTETCIDYIVTSGQQKYSRVVKNLISDHYPVEVCLIL